MATLQQSPRNPSAPGVERSGSAIAALVLAILALVVDIPFLVFVIFPPARTPGTENALGGYVLATIGFTAALFLLVPLVVLAAIFSIIATAKSRRGGGSLGRAALIVTVVALAVTVFLWAKILLPYWFVPAH